MPYVLIIHDVVSYSTWKSVFDQAAQLRKNAGERSYQLFHGEKDLNHVIHFSEWSSLDAAKRFFESAELVEIRKKAGVKMPKFIYLNEIEKGVL